MSSPSDGRNDGLKKTLSSNPSTSAPSTPPWLDKQAISKDRGIGPTPPRPVAPRPPASGDGPTGGWGTSPAALTPGYPGSLPPLERQASTPGYPGSPPAYPPPPAPVAPVAPAPAAPAASAAPPAAGADGIQVTIESEKPEMTTPVIDAMRTVFDPEIPVNIYDLGLIYGVKIDPEGAVDVVMTLTSPACPEAVTLPPTVEQAIRDVKGVKSSRVEVIWEPPWDPNRMSEAAKLQLGML